MTTSRSHTTALTFAILVAGAAVVATSARAVPLPSARLAASDAAAASVDNVQQVRHRRWRHRGWYGGGYYGFYAPPVYVVPRYSAYDYGYPGYYSYAPPRYYYDDYVYYERPYRRHSRAWARERFEHPLGRR
jgi:hypothetical protein